MFYASISSLPPYQAPLETFTKGGPPQEYRVAFSKNPDQECGGEEGWVIATLLLFDPLNRLQAWLRVESFPEAPSLSLLKCSASHFTAWDVSVFGAEVREWLGGWGCGKWWEEGQTGTSNPRLYSLSLSYPQGVKISRKMPPLLRTCCLTVLEPLTWVSRIFGTFFNLSSGMWVIKGYEIWAIIQHLLSQGRQQISKHCPTLVPLPSAAVSPFTWITPFHTMLKWE